MQRQLPPVYMDASTKVVYGLFLTPAVYSYRLLAKKSLKYKTKLNL